MNTVNKSTANWRLFGGGGLAIGGFLYALANLLNKDGDKDVFWIWVISIAIVVLFQTTDQARFRATPRLVGLPQ